MRIKFLRLVQYESEGKNKGPIYEGDSVHELRDDLAQRWLRRGVAVPVANPEPAAAPVWEIKDPPGPPTDGLRLHKLASMVPLPDEARLAHVAEDVAKTAMKLDEVLTPHPVRKNEPR